MRRSISWVLMYSHYNATVNVNNWIYVTFNFCNKIIELRTLVLITRHHMTHKYIRSLKMPSYEWLLVISISGYRCNHLLTATLRSDGFEEKLWRVSGEIVLVILLIIHINFTMTIAISKLSKTLTCTCCSCRNFSSDKILARVVYTSKGQNLPVEAILS